ncbi:MAG TPA: cupin domain-containing protein [Bacteroidales bacterium]|nr:cupin domain-containing protein [Bacteroidales bacterium]HPS72895.1 cupin domain-containing protein [Bacteroidales bacterium]
MTHFITSLESAPPVQGTLDGRILFTSDRFEVVHLTLKPGEGMELHSMPFEVVFFVREGEGTLRIEEERLHAIAGDCIHVEHGVKRGWKNNSDQLLKVLVLKLRK